MTLRESIDIPPFWLALCAALAWAQARFLPVWEPGPFWRGAGGVLVLAGVLLMAAALVEFRRHRTTVIPHREPSALIASGVYRRSRNPIYLADALILAGLALWWGAVSGLVLVPLFMALVTARFIRPEEARLRARFGAAFEAWAGRTRRWL